MIVACEPVFDKMISNENWGFFFPQSQNTTGRGMFLVVETIFQYLDRKSLQSAAQVCEEWSQIIGSETRTLKHVTQVYCDVNIFLF